MSPAFHPNHMAVSAALVIVSLFIQPSAALARQTAESEAVRVAWRYRSEGAVRGTPAISGDRVHIGGADGRLRALDLATGRLLWQYDAGAPIASTPAVAENAVIVATRDNAVHLLDRNGRRRWRVEMGADRALPWGAEGWDYYTSSPLVNNGVIHVGGGDGFLYTFALRDGRLRWRAETGGRIRSSPALAGDAVIVGSGDGFVYAFDAATGALRWRTATEGTRHDAARFGFDRRQLQGSPVVSGSVVLIGARDGALYALDARSGAIRWTERDPVDSTSWVVSRPAVTVDGMVVYGRSGSQSVHGTALANGERRWRQAATGLVLASPVIADGVAYVGDGRGMLLALNAADGTVRWRLRLGTGLYSSPVLAGSRLVVGSDDGTVYALDVSASLAPARVVYWDSSRAGRSLFGRAPLHRVVRDELVAAGYGVVDAAGLASFLDSRNADRLPSVVVFGMDALPPELDRDTVRAARLREYLARGGKVVWVGAAPGFNRVDDRGRISGTDRALAEALSGVPHDSARYDNYGLVRTRAGEEWGLPAGGTGELSVPVVPGMVVLAFDETGRAAVWVRGFGGAAGTGFVRLPPELAVRRPAVVKEIADAGVLTALP